MKKASLHNRKGFTLVEILVVITIIGLLASLISVAATSAIHTAKKTRAKNQLTEIAKAISSYYNTYHFWPTAYDVGTEDVDIKINGKQKQDIEEYITLPLSAKTINLKKKITKNRKGIVFYEMSASQFNDMGHFFDSLGNTEFHILIDGDNDGAIDLDVIEKNKVKETVSGGKNKLLGKIHMYAYPEDESEVNKNLITTWD